MASFQNSGEKEYHFYPKVLTRIRLESTGWNYRCLIFTALLTVKGHKESQKDIWDVSDIDRKFFRIT